MSDEEVSEVVRSSPNVETVKIEATRILGPSLLCKFSLDNKAREEVAALEHARKLGIRAPIVRRVIPKTARADTFIIMDRIQGKTLEQLWPQLGILDTILYALQLRKFINTMHESTSQVGGGLRAHIIPNGSMSKPSLASHLLDLPLI